ncbi:MAG TPA: hypothetical protein VGQ94_01525 [Terriglobales bacterium]|nr:hypothetical protein [Terriglobales bacterium]
MLCALHPHMALVLLKYALWMGGWAFSLAVVLTMVRRKLQPEFPFFFSYAAFQAVSAPLLFALHQRGVYADYFYAYWVTSALGIGLGVTVLYEVFFHAFRPYAALRGLGSMIFRWAALVLLLVAVITALSAPAGQSPLITAILSLERSIRMMQCGLLILMLFFSPQLGLSWRSHLFGIAAGFGGYAAVSLTLVSLRAQLGVPGDSAYTLISSGAYTFAALLWFAYLLAPEPARQAVRVQLVPDSWDFALQGIGRTQPPESFLSNMEKTVDRVLNEANGKNGKQ